MKKEILAKRYGKNLVTLINGEKKTKVINTEQDKKDEEKIKNKILLYNKTNSKSLLDEILNLIDKTKVEKDKKIAKEKGVKKAIKKEQKKVKKETKSNSDLIDSIDASKLSEKDTAKLEKILKDKKATDSTSKANVTPSPRKGEW